MKKTQTALLLFLLTAIAITAALIGLQTPHKRYAVFAGYNQNGTIPPYVITYLKALNEVADGVVYIADSPLKAGEEKKLDGLVIHTRHSRHNEYDWGSYKRGYNWLKRNGYLKNAKELIFANDSTYAPLGGSFKPMFQEMDKKKELDFWGNTQNYRHFHHIQSYFMVFKKQVFTHPAFNTFLNNVRQENNKLDVVYKYEIPFTPYLEQHGFKWHTYIPPIHPTAKPVKEEDTDPWMYPQTTVLTNHSPFLKRASYYQGYAPPKEPRQPVLEHIKNRNPEIYKTIKE